MSTTPTDPADPADRAFELIGGYQQTQLVVTAVELGLPDLLRDGPVRLEDLATRSGADLETLARLLRALDALGVCRRVADGRWAATAVGQALESGHPRDAASRARLVGRSFYALWAGLHDSVRTGRPAIEEMTGQRWIDHIVGRDDIASVFERTMVGMATTVAHDVLAAYEVPRRGTLVDVGGGTGGLVASLLDARPACSGVVYDLPEVVGRTREHLAARRLDERCDAIGGDFFADVPAGGDLYLLSFVLHDWPDDRAVTILRRCGEAMGPEARLLVIELVVPEAPPPVLPFLYDLHMLAVTGGRERTEAEYAALFRRAGLVHSATVPTAGPRTLLEARQGSTATTTRPPPRPTTRSRPQR